MIEKGAWERMFRVRKTPKQLMDEYWQKIQEAPGNIQPEPTSPTVERYAGDALRAPRRRTKKKK